MSRADQYAASRCALLTELFVYRKRGVCRGYIARLQHDLLTLREYYYQLQG